MLVLSRKIHERLLLDGDIRISVLRIRGNQVRLGIEAPDRVKVVRKELVPPVDGPPDEAEGHAPGSRSPARRSSRSPSPSSRTRRSNGPHEAHDVRNGHAPLTPNEPPTT